MDIRDLKSKLNTYESPLDLDAAWTALSEKKSMLKTKKLISISLLMLSLTLFFGILYTGKKYFIPQPLSKVKTQTITKDYLFKKGKTIIASTSSLYEQSELKSLTINSSDSFRKSFNLVNSSVRRARTYSNMNAVALNNTTNIKTTYQNKTVQSSIPYNINNRKLTNIKAQSGLTKEDDNKVEYFNRFSQITKLELPHVTKIPIRFNKMRLPLLSQEYNLTDSLEIRSPKNYLLFELFGQGGLYSLNYGRVLIENNRWQTTGQIGFSLYPKEINNVPTGFYPWSFQLSINESFKIKSNHFLTVGLGVSMINDKVLEEEPNYLLLIGNAKIGYRYEHKKLPLFIKGEVLTVSFFDNILQPKAADPFKIKGTHLWGSLGIGFRF